MLLSHRTSVNIRPEYSNIIGHMCYVASKLWNVCNYERRRYKELGLEKYPDWYYQKKAHKGDLWYRQLPSQTAQETCKQLDKAWKSFYALKKTGGIKVPNPPRFKQDNIPITYMQMGIRHEKGSGQLRLSLSKDLKSYMEGTYGIHEKFLYLENKIFRNMDHIKQLRIYPPEDGKCDLIVIYEVKEPELESDTSQCSPFSPEISKRYAEASNRKERGMYIADGVRYNADAVGAFNILRKHLSVSGKQKELSVTGLKNPEIIKVAV